MRAAALFAGVVLGVGMFGALVLIAAEVIKELVRQRDWDRHIDQALGVAMNQDIVGKVAYTEADSQRWALAEADGQIHADLIQSRHFVAQGLISRADAARLIADGIEQEARKLAGAFKEPYGEISPEVASALEAVA